MKILIYISLLFSSIEVFAQAQKEFVIKGNLGGLKNETLLYLIHSLNDKADTVSRTKAYNESFSFKGSVQLDGEPYFIKIDTITVKYPFKLKGYITFFLQNTHVNLNGSLQDLSINGIKFTGVDQTQNDYVDYMLQARIFDSTMQYSRWLRNLLRENPNSDSLIQFIKKQEINYRQQFYESWIEKHNNSFITPLILGYAYPNDDDSTKLISAFESLSKSAQESYLGRKVYDRIQITKNIRIGKIIPSFEFSSSDDALISLKKELAKGKLTLIDFWASWCVPCRKSFSELKSIYEQYSKKGLNIIGFSVDESKPDWENALTSEGLPWTNVRETQPGFAEKTYGVKYLPYSILVDSNGSIIAKEIGTKALSQILESLLK
jgi:thiol-disulfide isomerase/thioredoxin